MAQRKIFVSRTGVELAVRTLPENAEVFLEIKDGDTIIYAYYSKTDTADLIREMQKANKQIPEKLQ